MKTHGLFADEFLTRTDCAPGSGAFEILTLQDVENINQCKTFTGNITLANEWTESDSISFDGLEKVAGSLRIDFQNTIRSISAPSLREVDLLRLQSLYNLTSANFPALNNFTELDFNFIPNLVELRIPSETVASEIRKITINGASNITDLDWMIYPNIKSLSIMSCPRLSTIRIPKNTVVDLKQSYEFRYLDSLNTFDVSELVSVSGTFDVSDTALTSLNFSKLRNISGVVTIERSNITEITLPTPANITGLVILESYEDVTNACRYLDTNWPAHNRCEKVWRLVMATPVAWPGRRSLSAGAISGIVIGSVVAIGVLIGAVLLWRRRRRRNALKPNPPAVDEDKAKNEKARLSLHELESPMATLELSNGKERQELHSEDIKEGDGTSVKELDATGENARRGSWDAGEQHTQGSTGRE